jgi:hypothetical protein
MNRPKIIKSHALPFVSIFFPPNLTKYNILLLINNFFYLIFHLLWNLECPGISTLNSFQKIEEFLLRLREGAMQ